MINAAPWHVGAYLNGCVFYVSGHVKVQLFHSVIKHLIKISSRGPLRVHM